MLLAAFLAVMTSGFFFSQVDKGFMPEEDESRFIVAIKAPLGSSIDYTIEKISVIEDILALRVAGFSSQRDGYVDDIRLGRADPRDNDALVRAMKRVAVKAPVAVQLV